MNVLPVVQCSKTTIAPNAAMSAKNAPVSAGRCKLRAGEEPVLHNFVAVKGFEL